MSIEELLEYFKETLFRGAPDGTFVPKEGFRIFLITGRRSMNPVEEVIVSISFEGKRGVTVWAEEDEIYELRTRKKLEKALKTGRIEIYKKIS